MLKVLTLRKALEGALLPKQEIEAVQRLLSRLQTAPGVCSIDNITRGLPISLCLEPCISYVALAEMLLKHIPTEILDGAISVDDAKVVSEIAATTNKLRHAVEASRR